MNELENIRKLNSTCCLAVTDILAETENRGCLLGSGLTPIQATYIVHCNYENLDKWADISTTICKGGTVL